MRPLAIIIGLALAVSAAAIEVAPKHSEHRLVRVKLDANESIAVLSEGFAPVDLITIPGSVSAFTGPPGKYAIIVSRDGSLAGVRTIQIMRTGPDDSRPDDSRPDDSRPDDSPPDDPAPAVPNQYGVGKAAYDAAVRVGDASDAAALADVYASAAARFAGLDSGDLIADVSSTNAWIAQQSRARIDDQPKWDAWGAAVKAALTRSWSAGNNSREGYVAMINEIADAMRLVR